MKNVNTYTLSDNTVIVVSPMKNSSTGYLDATYSPAWTLDLDRPFIACVSKNDTTFIGDLDTAPHRNSHHLGYYSDSREATYVGSRFRAEPVDFKIALDEVGGTWTEFPEDLYELPVTLSLSDAQKKMVEYRTKKVKKNRVVKVTLKKEALKVKTDFPNHSLNSSVNKGLFTKMTKSYDIDGLYTKFGAKMVTDARNLTAQEFVDLFGL